MWVEIAWTLSGIRRKRQLRLYLRHPQDVDPPGPLQTLGSSQGFGLDYTGYAGFRRRHSRPQDQVLEGWGGDHQEY